MTAVHDINGTIPLSGDVHTDLFYFSDPTQDGKKPYNTNGGKDGVRKTNFQSVKYPSVIHDITGHEKDTSIDVTGFQVVHAPTNFKDFDDEAKIKAEYYHEVEELYKKLTGCSRVFIFDHTVRRTVAGENDKAQADSPLRRGPGLRVHIDQTPKAVVQRVRRHMGDDADELLKKRYQLVNLWRPIEHPVYNFPLAVADGRTVSQEDLVPTDLIYPDFSGETYNIKYNPKMKWYYKREITPDDIYLLKCHDSKPGVTSITPHTAFDNGGFHDKPGRKSIEVRALLFFSE